MLLFVAVPDRSTARNTIPSSPAGLIPPLPMKPPMLTAVLRSKVGGALEFHTAAAAVNTVVGLVLESMPRTVGLIDGEPLLVASAAASFAREQTPGLAAVGLAPQVVAKKGQVNVRLEAQIEKLPDLIGICHRVAAEDVILQNTGERPSGATVGRESPAGLPEVGGNVVELSPGDCHLAAVRGVNGNRALIRGVSEDILPTRIDIHLVTDE